MMMLQHQYCRLFIELRVIPEYRRKTSTFAIKRDIINKLEPTSADTIYNLLLQIRISFQSIKQPINIDVFVLQLIPIKMSTIVCSASEIYGHRR